MKIQRRPVVKIQRRPVAKIQRRQVAKSSKRYNSATDEEDPSKAADGGLENDGPGAGDEAVLAEMSPLEDAPDPKAELNALPDKQSEGPSGGQSPAPSLDEEEEEQQGINKLGR